MLYLPACGHLVNVRTLDEINLNGVYRVAGDGTIVSVNSNLWPKDILEPRCACGSPCLSLRRYEVNSKLARFGNVFDQLLAKMGRKMHHFASDIDRTELMLVKNFDLFIQDIRPNPLAAKANTALLLRRNREILELQKQVTKFRNEVVDVFERNLAKLHNAFPNIIPSYAIMFRLHFDVLEHRVLRVRIADSLRLASHMLTLQDPSYGLQRQAMKMIQFACKEALVCGSYCEDVLRNGRIQTNPTLEVEVRLQQVQFSLLAKASQFRLTQTGISVEDPESLSSDDMISSRLEAVIDLCKNYSEMQSFMQSAQDFQELIGIYQGTTLTVPKIKNEGARQLEKLWGQHELGSLATCESSHVYSAKTFSEGCPECGKPKLPVKNYPGKGKHLFEEEFLAAMHAKIGKLGPPSFASTLTDGAGKDEDHTSDTPAKENGSPCLGMSARKPLKELTNEEKFLLAMRKRLPATGEVATEIHKISDETFGENRDLAPAGVAESEQPVNEAAKPVKEMTNEERFLVEMRKI